MTSSDHPGSIGPQSTSSHRLVHALNGISLLGLFGYALATYGDLPERFPIHFDGAGNPNGWTDKGWGTWLAMPLVAVGMTLIMYLSGQVVGWARKHPKLLSLPYKDKFLALPAKVQEPIWREMKALVYWLALPMNLLMFYVQVALHHSATGQKLVVWPLFFAIGLMILLTVFLTVRLIRNVKRAVGKA